MAMLRSSLFFRAGVVAGSIAILAMAPRGASAQKPAAAPAAEPGQLAPLLDGLSELHHKVTTKSDRAQKFFDQGLRLVYAFNHAEAVRAFKEAQRLDPECAMAYWGEALALGPNLNATFQPQNIAPAYAAAQKAVSLQGKASVAEQALIRALATRYAPDGKTDRATLDRAYAEAMGKVAETNFVDDDALTLSADAIMNLMPWNYYFKDGTPREGTAVAVRKLEIVIARNPKHIGALHLYIHITEEHFPKKAEQAADALLPATSTAGHLIHMPSHTYIRLGRNADAFESNRRAVEADEHYIAQCKVQGLYPLSYYPHNIHFLMWAAERQGRADMAILQARKVAKMAHDNMAGTGMSLYETFYSTPWQMMLRFGRWDEVLAEPVPEEKSTYVQGIWHYARGVAFANKGKLREAAQELKVLRQVAEKTDFGALTIGFNDPRVLTQIALAIVEGSIASARNNHDAAIAAFDRAVRLEDSLTYSEPPDWPLPLRHFLGAELLAAKRLREAETVYWIDLTKNTENGYALFGLWQTLQAQEGREADAAAVKARFDKAWKDADHKLTNSQY